MRVALVHLTIFKVEAFDDREYVLTFIRKEGLVKSFKNLLDGNELRLYTFFQKRMHKMMTN